MKTIKVIDLLNKIANGELEDETKFKYNDAYYKYWKRSKQFDRYTAITYGAVESYNDNLDIDLNALNDEIEVIEDTPKEDKKIEKIKIRNTTDNGLYVCSHIEINGNTYYSQNSDIEYQFAKKINEIIDKVNGDK